MAGGFHLSLTSQTSVANLLRSDRISVGNPAPTTYKWPLPSQNINL